jgi:predicted PurR-regulated permease PerM
MAVIGVLSALGLWVVGAPFPFGLGVLAGVLAFIPYIGATIALVAATLLAAVKSSSLAMAVFAIYVGIHVIEGYVLAPLVQKRLVYLPPALTITAQFLLWILAGILGLIVATPLTAAALTLTKKLYIEDTLGEPGS